MASVLSTLGANALLDGTPWPPTYASVHSADPGATGTSNELTGGTPAYARKALTWAAGATRAKALAATFPVFDVPAGSTVAYVGLWSAIAGTYLGCWQVTSEVFAGQGTFTVSAGSLSL